MCIRRDICAYDDLVSAIFLGGKYNKEKTMMKEYYDRKKLEAVCTLTDILGYSVENTKSGVTAALALALRDGTARIAAIADRAANTWFWADNETCEEEYKTSVAWQEDKHDDTEPARHDDASSVDEAKEEHVDAEHADAAASAVKAQVVKPVSA